MSKKSVVWKVNKESFQKLFDENHSVTDILKILGLNAYNGNHRTVKDRVKTDNIDLTKFNKNKEEFKRAHFKKLKDGQTKSDNEVFCQNSSYTNNSGLKSRLLKKHGFEYECSCCNNKGEHMGQPLALQLDHINGINNDNRLENLRFLCPNCHSQTKTFGGKNGREESKCPHCKIKIKNKSKTCRKCRTNRKTKIVWPTSSELQELVWKKPLTQLSKDLKVSDVAIKKHCKKNDIELPKRGYWIKKVVP